MTQARITARKLAQALTSQGISCSPATTARWAKQHPGIAQKIGGRVMFRPEVVELLLNGIDLSAIAARMRGAGHGLRAA